MNGPDQDLAAAIAKTRAPAASASSKLPHHSLADLQRASNEKTRRMLVGLPETIFGDPPPDMDRAGSVYLELELVATLPFERFVSRSVEAGPVRLAVLETTEYRIAVDLPPGVRVQAQQAQALRRKTTLVAGLSSGLADGVPRVYRLAGNRADLLVPDEIWPAVAALQALEDITEEHINAWAGDPVTLAGLRAGARALLGLEDFLHRKPEEQLAALEAATQAKLLTKAEATSAVALPLYQQRVAAAIDAATSWRELAQLLDALAAGEDE